MGFEGPRKSPKSLGIVGERVSDNAQSQTDGAPRDHATIRAVGHLTALLATLMHRKGIIEVSEFAEILAIFAKITAETDPASGLALAYWAGTAREAEKALD